jgi:proline racemase
MLGNVYTGELVREVQIGDRLAVVPTISGQAWITGYCTYVLDADDPYPNGFTVGDIWASQEECARGRQDAGAVV